MDKVQFKERAGEVVFLLASLLSIVFIILISYFIFKEGLVLFTEVSPIDFLTGTEWRPSASDPKFGILPMILGSVQITILAIIISFPVALFTSIYLAIDCPDKLYRFLKPALNLMAGIPSVVYGFFALNFIVPIIRNNLGGNGLSILAAGILLAIMVLPTMVSLGENAIRSVPRHYYEGSVALGANHDRSVMKVVVPAARSGIFAGMVLGVGRAIGETMAVVLVAGNQPRITFNPLDGIRTMTTNIVLEMGYAHGMHRTALITTAMVLFIFILIINIAFFIIQRRSDKND